MTDTVTLVRLARRTLAEPDRATLLVQGVGAVGEIDGSVVLHDGGGQPTFFCDAGSPLAVPASLGAAAILTLTSEREPGEVVFAGALDHVGVEVVDGLFVDVIALHLNAVIVESEPADAPLCQQRLELAEYFAHEAGGAAGTVGGRQGERACRHRDERGHLLRHLNDDHAADLRDYVRRRRPGRSVASAALSAADDRGATLSWIDEFGAHRTRLDFPREAPCLEHWRTELHQMLTAATAPPL